MRRPDPACSLSRASGRLAARKAAALNTHVDGAAGWVRPLDAARTFTSGTDLDPSDLLGLSRAMVLELLAELAHTPPDTAPQVLTGFLMDAVAHGYHARMLEQEPSEVRA